MNPFKKKGEKLLSMPPGLSFLIEGIAAQRRSILLSCPYCGSTFPRTDRSEEGFCPECSEALLASLELPS
jgi:hypothetical protein